MTSFNPANIVYLSDGTYYESNKTVDRILLKSTIRKLKANKIAVYHLDEFSHKFRVKLSCLRPLTDLEISKYPRAKKVDPKMWDSLLEFAHFIPELF